MSEDGNNLLFSFSGDLEKDGSFKLPAEKLKELYANGVRKISVNIYSALNSQNEMNKMSEKIFDKVKKMQSLPDLVVKRFIKTKGKLKGKKFPPNSSLNEYKK